MHRYSYSCFSFGGVRIAGPSIPASHDTSLRYACIPRRCWVLTDRRCRPNLERRELPSSSCSSSDRRVGAFRLHRSRSHHHHRPASSLQSTLLLEQQLMVVRLLLVYRESWNSWLEGKLSGSPPWAFVSAGFVASL